MRSIDPQFMKRNCAEIDELKVDLRDYDGVNLADVFRFETGPKPVL
jgi:hypothetical protein